MKCNIQEVDIPHIGSSCFRSEQPCSRCNAVIRAADCCNFIVTYMTIIQHINAALWVVTALWFGWLKRGLVQKRRPDWAMMTLDLTCRRIYWNSAWELKQLVNLWSLYVIDFHLACFNFEIQIFICFVGFTHEISPHPALLCPSSRRALFLPWLCCSWPHLVQ